MLILVGLSTVLGTFFFLAMLASGGTPSGKGAKLEVYKAEITQYVIFGENQQRPQNLTKIVAKEGVFIVRNKYDFIGKWKNGYEFSEVYGKGYAAQKFICANNGNGPRNCLKVKNK